MYSYVLVVVTFFLAFATVVMRNFYLLADIDALSFMIENMVSAVYSSAFVTNIIYIVFVSCCIVSCNHHFGVWSHLLHEEDYVCNMLCICQYWGCGRRDVTPHALNVANHLGVSCMRRRGFYSFISCNIRLVWLQWVWDTDVAIGMKYSQCWLLGFKLTIV